MPCYQNAVWSDTIVHFPVIATLPSVIFTADFNPIGVDVKPQINGVEVPFDRRGNVVRWFNSEPYSSAWCLGRKSRSGVSDPDLWKRWQYREHRRGN